MKSTGFDSGLNHDLATEALRIRDALIMYPDERKKSDRILNVIIGTTPSDKPRTVTEWLTNIIINREKHTPFRWITPTAEEITAREKLTIEQKALLKAISYKLSSQHSMVSLAA